MNKKATHVGAVLSFVIFVTFLVFLYSIVEPKIRIQKDKESFLDYLRIELLERVSANLTSITVSAEETASCIKLNDFIEDAEIDSHIIVKNAEGEILNAEISSDSKDLLIESSDDFFKIFNSEDFDGLPEESIIPCTELENGEGYFINLIITAEYVFETKVIGLIEEYETEGGYEALRDELKIPSGSDFGFGFAYSNGTAIGTEEKEVPINIYVREIPIQYVDKEANVLLGTINIRVW